MKEKIIKDIQKFINIGFNYSQLLIFLDKQKDFLLKKNILEKTEECEYNALWDTILDLEKFFLFGNKPSLVIKARISILKIFDYNLKERIKLKTKKI